MAALYRTRKRMHAGKHWIGACRSVAFGCVSAALLCAPAGRAAARPPQPWWHEQWRYRYLVDVPFAWGWWDRTRVAEVDLCFVDKANENGRDILVVTDGRRVPRKIGPKRAGGWRTVTFEVLPGDRRFAVYFGNPDAKGKHLFKNWRPKLSPLTVATYASPSRNYYRGYREIDALIRRSTPMGSGPAKWINHVFNKFGRDDRYVSFYQGLLECAESGEYEFGLATDESGFFFLDNRLILESKTRSPRSYWDVRKTVPLEAGVHHVICFHSEAWGNQTLRLGWRRPGCLEMEVIPPWAYVDRLRAFARSLESRDGAGGIPFVQAHARYGTARAGEQVFQYTKVSFIGDDAPDGIAWSIADVRASGKDVSLYLPVGTWPLTLSSNSGDGVSPFWPHVMRVPQKTEPVPVSCRMTPVAYPRFLYTDEQRKIHLRVENFRVERDLSAAIKADVGGRRLALTDDRMDLSRLHSRVVTIPVPGNPLDAGRAQPVHIWAEALGHPVCTFDFILSDLHDIESRVVRNPFCGDVLVDDRGRLVIPVYPRDDPNRHRKWALVKWVAGKLRNYNRHYLYLGDSFGQEGGSLHHALRDAVEDDDIQWQIGAGGHSLLATLPALTSCLASSRAESGLIVLGSGDVDFGWDREALHRCVELIIHKMESAASNVRIAVVAPPPVPGSEPESERLRDVAREVAQFRRVAFVDLYEHLIKDTEWMKAYRVAEGVYRAHPAQEAVSQWIAWVVREAF